MQLELAPALSGVYTSREACQYAIDTDEKAQEWNTNGGWIQPDETELQELIAEMRPWNPYPVAD